jgi:hypothetical protein
MSIPPVPMLKALERLEETVKAPEGFVIWIPRTLVPPVPTWALRAVVRVPSMRIVSDEVGRTPPIQLAVLLRIVVLSALVIVAARAGERSEAPEIKDKERRVIFFKGRIFKDIKVSILFEF